MFKQQKAPLLTQAENTDTKATIEVAASSTSRLPDFCKPLSPDCKQKTEQPIHCSAYAFKYANVACSICCIALMLLLLQYSPATDRIVESYQHNCCFVALVQFFLVAFCCC